MKNLLLIFIVVTAFSCSKDDLDIDFEQATVWTGAQVTFEKKAGADPELEENQDRISDNVWITRGNDGGQIYNAKIEDNAGKNSSPKGTLWAIGNIEDRAVLDFKDFREAVSKPKQVVGKDLVLYLEVDKIFLTVKFQSWSGNQNGGFSYTRSSVN
jgi:hypothetical protein